MFHLKSSPRIVFTAYCSVKYTSDTTQRHPLLLSINYIAIPRVIAVYYLYITAWSSYCWVAIYNYTSVILWKILSLFHCYFWMHQYHKLRCIMSGTNFNVKMHALYHKRIHTHSLTQKPQAKQLFSLSQSHGVTSASLQQPVFFFFFIIYFFIQLPRKALADCLKSFCTLQLQRTKQAACNCPTCSQTRQEEEVPTKVCLVLLNLIPFPAKVVFSFFTHYIAVAWHIPSKNIQMEITSLLCCLNSTKHPVTDVRGLTGVGRTHVSRSSEFEIKILTATVSLKT